MILPGSALVAIGTFLTKGLADLSPSAQGLMRSFRRHLVRATLVTAIGTGVAMAACSESRDMASLTGVRQTANRDAPDLNSEIDTLVGQFFKLGHATSVSARWRNITRALARGDTDDAQRKLVELVIWFYEHNDAMTPQPAETADHAIARLVLLMAAYVYEGPDAVVPVLTATTGATLGVLDGWGMETRISSPDGLATIFFPEGASTQLTYVVITNIEALDKECSGPLPTSLCQYPVFRHFSVFPEYKLDKPAEITLCLSGRPAPSDLSQLRIAHQKPSDPAAFHRLGTIDKEIELLPTIDPHYLPRCSSGNLFGGEVLMFSDFALVDVAQSRPPAALVFLNPPHLVTAGVIIQPPIVVELRDDLGRVVTSATDPVTLRITCEVDGVYCTVGEGSRDLLQGTPTQTPEGGRATFDDVALLEARYLLYQLVATTESGLRATRSIQSTQGPAARLIVLSGDGQTAQAGREVVAPIVNIEDAYGNRVGQAGVTVRFVPSGDGWVQNSETVTNWAGQATPGAWRLGSTPGPNTLTASAEGLATAQVFAIGTTPSFFASVVAAGHDFTCAVSSSLPYCWGPNDYGQLGDGTFTPRNRPTAIGGGLLALTQITAGVRFACGLALNGDAYCWGDNTFGQLGSGNNDPSLTPVRVVGGHSFRMISAGGSHVCALRTDNTAWCWGFGSNGELGSLDQNGSTPDRLAPTRVLGQGYTDITAGGFHTCAIGASGAAWCWGNNSDGRIGDGTTANYRFLPAAVAGGRTFTRLSAGGAHTCGISEGAVYCWGRNNQGQVGTGSASPTPERSPVASQGALGTAFELAAGGGHTCALTIGIDEIVSAYCWGANNQGQLGDGTTTQRALGSLVVGATPFARISGGYEHTCATQVTGAAYCWGSNASGRLGFGAFSPFTRAIPTMVATPTPP